MVGVLVGDVYGVMYSEVLGTDGLLGGNDGDVVGSNDG